MLVDTAEVIDYLQLDSIEEDVKTSITKLQERVEEWIKGYCRRELELRAYRESYDGGGELLFLKQFPIVSIERLACGFFDVVAVTNTTPSAVCSVSVTATGVVLRKGSISDSTITFAANATIAAVVTAISAKGNGWSALLESQDYGGYPSTELITIFGRNCSLGQYVYLPMSDYNSYGMFETYQDEGYLYMTGGWPAGKNNILVEYTAGYATIPDDIKLAVQMAVKHIYTKSTDFKAWGIKSFSLGDLSITYEDGSKDFPLPREIVAQLSRYRKVLT